MTNFFYLYILIDQRIDISFYVRILTNSDMILGFRITFRIKFFRIIKVLMTKVFLRVKGSSKCWKRTSHSYATF